MTFEKNAIQQKQQDSERMTARICFCATILFAVAAADTCAQAGSSSLTPGSQSADSTSDGCSLASGDVSGCNSTGSSDNQPADIGGYGMQSALPDLAGSSASRNSPNVYRDNAGEAGNPRAEQAAQRVLANQQPLTEFQILVAGSVGYIVPIYGADLFTEVPDTFAPVQRIPVGPDYTIGPGDEILIRTWGQIGQNLHLTVDRSGSIYIPQVGEVHVAGLPFGQLQDFLKSHYAYVFRNFDLNVNLGQLRSIQVFLTGEAQHPGNYPIRSLGTLVNAIFACGGPTIAGSLRHIEVRRGATLVTDFDLYDLLLRGDKSKDVPLQSGDVIYFPPAGPRIAVVGSVQVPAIYELRDKETIE